MKTKTFPYLVASLLIISSLNCYSRDENSQDDKRRGPPQFSELDLDSNGEISLEEFKEHKVPHGSSEDIFMLIDTDENGVISETELTSHKPPQHKCCHDQG